MLIYDLCCDQGHSFEGWFDDKSDFEDQQAKQILVCPICESPEVIRKLAMPKLPKKSNQAGSIGGKVSINAPSGADLPVSTAKPSAQAYAKLQEMLKKVHNHVDQNFKDVGHNFTDEALSMHRGEKEHEPIRGVANAKQVKLLADEGVEAVALPERPVDKDKLN